MRRIAVGALAAAVLALSGADARAVEQRAIDQAIERGVQALRSLQREDGSWPYSQSGATALAGLTLLECGAPPTDPAVLKAANFTRRASVRLTHTYSVSLAILFLDRLGDPGDVAFIESLAVRLLAGQTASGGWNYDCPAPADAEARRLTAQLARQAKLIGQRGRPKVAPGKRTVRDMPRAIQEQLALLNRLAPGAANPTQASDNSNTQFATLALWVARRHGLPVGPALQRVETRFRLSQNADGGWGYMNVPGLPGPGMGGSTATMTCAGLLGLAVGHGAEAERRPRGRGPDVNKDARLRAALMVLGTAIGQPMGGRGPAAPAPAGGKAYYFFWSLERVAVALGLETIGKKDWYAWGAEVLLASQGPDGTWRGEYGDGGADTCFALLFLKRANLARDLTAQLGKVGDPGEKVLRAGGVGGRDLQPPALQAPLGNDLARVGKPPPPAPTPRPVARPPADPPAVAPRPARPEAEPDAARLTEEVIDAPASRQGPLLEQLRDGKGADYTAALTRAIPRLSGDARARAREALVDRLARMKDRTLDAYLEDEEPEIRRAAALAVAAKESRALVPGLIRLLGDRRPDVAAAAHQALKTLTRQDFGPARGAGPAERARAAAAWERWWSKHKDE